MKTETINQPSGVTLKQTSFYVGPKTGFKVKLKNGQVVFGFSFWNSFCPMFVMSCNLNSPRYAKINTAIGKNYNDTAEMNITATLGNDDWITVVGARKDTGADVYIYSDVVLLSAEPVEYAQLS